MAHDTIEIYVRDLSEDEVTQWLRETFGTVERGTDAPIVTYESPYQETTVSVQVTEHVENGPFTSLWFNASDMPWDAAPDCARDAYDGLEKEVLCFLNDPEQPWTLLRVSEEGEEYVDKREVAL